MLYSETAKILAVVCNGSELKPLRSLKSCSGGFQWSSSAQRSQNCSLLSGPEELYVCVCGGVFGTFMANRIQQKQRLDCQDHREESRGPEKLLGFNVLARRQPSAKTN